IYRRLDGVASAVDFPAAFTRARMTTPEGGEAEPAVARTPPPNLALLADRVLVQRVAPAAVVGNEKGEVPYTSGPTGKFLEPTVGKPNLNIFAMAREGLRFELSSAFAVAQREERVVTVHGLHVGSNGGTTLVDLTVQRLNEPKELRGATMVIIYEVPKE